MSTWASNNRGGQVREALTMLLPQAGIDDLLLRSDEEFPFRISVPSGVIPRSERQAAHFAPGAAMGHLGRPARGGESRWVLGPPRLRRPSNLRT